MSSPSLSDSPGTFKVVCNVAGALLENRPKFKFLQNSSDFFFFHLLLSTRKSFKPQNRSSWLLHHSFVLGSRTGQVVSKRSKDREQNGRQNPAAACRHRVGLWFVAILMYPHVISMNIINLTTQS